MYAYSADDLRKTLVSSSGTVQFVWDAQNVLQETDGTGALQAQYTDNPGYWGGLVSQRRSGVSSFYSADMSQNIRLLTDVNGTVTDTYLYDAFGVEL